MVDSGSSSAPGADWRSDHQTRGAWVELAWPGPRELREITIVRNSLAEPGLTAGFLTFGDGSSIDVRLSTTERSTTVPFTSRTAGRLRFTASEVSAGALNVTVSEMIVSSSWSGSGVGGVASVDGNVAPGAVASGSGGGSEARTVQDGSIAAGARGVGAAWTAEPAVGSWVQLDWARPQELDAVQLSGGPANAASVAGGRLTFSDGAVLPVGAILPDSDRPTVVAFMPRVVTSVRFTIDLTNGSGAVALGEVRTYQRGATPVRTLASGSTPSPAPSSTCPAMVAAAAPPVLTVQCPLNGSSVNGSVDMRVAAPTGYSSVSATLWPGNGTAAVGPTVTTSPDASGSAVLALATEGLPAGPLTVDVVATGVGRAAETVYFQLYRRGASVGDVPSSLAAAGLTLVYADDFDQPVTLSRDGTRADYAAAKPTPTGAEDFGDAPFGDPARGAHSVGVVDGRYLSIDVGPDAAGSTRPVGGLIASARRGGSGFSAQYGYFEARMLVPASPGTWPAFWMLPSDNLVAPTPKVAEIDAIESYGHDPAAACHSTHTYANGRDTSDVQCGQAFSSVRQALAWHTYGASVTPTGVGFFVDGKQVATAPQVPGGDAPMFFMLDLALGGGWPVDLRGVQNRASVYVDYVRVYV